MDEPATLPMLILGRKLMQLRIAVNMTQSQVAKRARFSAAKLSQIENGKVRATLFDVAGLCRIYDADSDFTRELERMAIEIDNPGWWESYDTSLLQDFPMFLELEEICAEIDIHESDLVTGLLQTPEYASGVHERDELINNGNIEQAVRLRRQRQDRFWSRDPLPKVRVVMQETAFIRPFKGIEDQIKHVREMGKNHESLEIRVMPFSEGLNASMRGSYTIITSGIEEISDVVYTESVTGSRYEPDSSIVEACRSVFDATWKAAVPLEEYLDDTRKMAQI